MSPEMQADLARWQARQHELAAQGQANTFEEAKDALQKVFEQLPEHPVVPPELTPEGQRLASFKAVCPAESLQKTDRALLGNQAAFDKVAAWNGEFPGPLAVGPTGMRKTGAAWAAVGRAYVRENHPFAWFPVRKLIADMAKCEEAGETEVFFRRYDHFKALMIDDLDKINLQFSSQVTALWAFYDWVARTHKPVVATTNQPRSWWEQNLGSTLARRMFEEAHTPVQF